MAPSRKSIETRDFSNLESMLRYSPVVAIVWDLSQSWPVLFVSPNIDQFGYTADDFMSARITWDQVILPEDLVLIREQVFEAMESGVNHSEQRYRIRDAEGTIHWISDYTTFIRDNEGRAHTAQGLLVDISDQVAAEQRTCTFIHHSINIYVALDHKGYVTDINPRAEQLLGRQEAVVGRRWVDDVLAGNSRHKFEQFWTALTAKGDDGDAGTIDCVVLDVNGQEHEIEWQYVAIRDGADQIESMQLFGHDRTAERVAERVRDAELRFLGGNPNPAFQLYRDGSLGLTNEAAAKLFESAQLGSEEERQHFAALKADWAAQTEASVGHFLMNGRVYWVRIDPTVDPRFCDVYAVDVTLQRQQQRLIDELVTNTPGLVVRYQQYLNGDEFIDIINPEALSRFNLAEGNIQGRSAKPFWSAILPECRKHLREQFSRSADDLSAWQAEWRIADDDGKTRWMSGTGNPMRHTDGSTSWTIFILDITEQKRDAETLSTAMEQTIDVLADAVEMRDAYTAGHQRHVSVIAELIAREMGLDQQSINGIRLAGSVHDIGKIRIPIEILSKPDRLTAVEYELIKGHSEFGAELLSRISAPWPLAEIVRQHHERIDGTGYPDGLKGEDILIEAKIIAVADVLEAISSDRPYRAARGLAAAEQELTRGRGKIYDPDAVDAALALIQRGELQFQGGLTKPILHHAPASQV